MANERRCFLSKKRVYEVAKEFSMTSKNLIKKLAKIDIEVKNHMSTLSDEDYDRFIEFINPDKEEKVVEKKVSKETKNKSQKKKERVKNKKVEVTEEQKVRKPRNYEKRQRGTKSQYKKKKSDDTTVIVGTVEVEENTPLSELAKLFNISPNELIMKFMELGEMISINSTVSYDNAALVAMEYGIETTRKKELSEVEEEKFDFEDDEKDLKDRAPVVTVMGHVDHGKTSLLDTIRNTNVTNKEAGGITQHIGASEIYFENKKIVFLDTPGHEAFTTLRARGAQVTDIAILVVAADDGVKPQTIEAIHHAKDAGVPMIVAINKMDKPGVNPQKVKQELSEQGVLVEEWGGDVISVNCSAKTGEGVDQILEMILLVAEMLELKANPNRAGVGTVIEANIDKRMGITATILLEKGRMKIGDSIFAGASYGRVRTMTNDKGKRIKKAGPSSAFEITGLNEVPNAGDKIYVTESDQEARENAEKNAEKIRKDRIQSTQKVTTLDNIFDGINEGDIKELNVILRADVHGSIEAISQSLNKLSNEEVKVNIVKAQVGAITESDILLATASNAIIFGFNVRPSNNIVAVSEREKIEIRTYRIIYELISDVKDALSGLLEPEKREEVEGSIEVRDTFKVPGIGTIAGGYVQNGKVSRKSKVRLIREGIVIYEGEVSSLKRFKDDAKEVLTGFECGIGLNNYNDIKVGDVIETFIIKEIKRDLK